MLIVLKAGRIIIIPVAPIINAVSENPVKKLM